jgi:hypothetical protein
MIRYCLDDQGLIPGWVRAVLFSAIAKHKKFITMFTRAWQLFKSRCEISNMFVLGAGKSLLVFCPTPKLEDHSLLAVHVCMFNICSLSQHLEFVSYIHNIRMCCAVVMINPVNQNTHFSIFIYMFEGTCSRAVTIIILAPNLVPLEMFQVPVLARTLAVLAKDFRGFPHPCRQMPEYYHRLDYNYLLCNSVFTNCSLPIKTI